MEGINKYSGVIGLVTSLLTLAYMLGIMSAKIENKYDRKDVIDVTSMLLDKERNLSDKSYYIKPEIATKYMTKEHFNAYMDAQIMEMKVLIMESEKRINTH